MSIKTYPGLYKDVDYEKSKMKVLDHVFFTIGNGLEMAQTAKPEEGGYVVDPVVSEIDGEWKRRNDMPYGQRTVEPLSKNYFDSPAKSDYHFHPYPFSKNYSIACNVYYDGVFLQEDWMKELILLCKRTLEFFEDPEQYKHDCYYPTEGSLRSDLRTFEDTLKNEGIKGVKNLRKLWGYKPGDTIPTIDELMARKQEAFDTYHKKQVKFLKSFLKRFDKTK